MERQAEVGEGGDGASGEERFEEVKSVLAVCAPMEDCVLPGQGSGPAMAAKFFT